MKLLEATPEITRAIAGLNLESDSEFARQLRLVLSELVRKNRQDVSIINGRLDIGHPSLTLTNGQPGNVFGSYVTVEFEAGDLNVATTFTHNLNIPLVGGGATGTTPNVIWWPVFIRAGVATVPGAATTTSFDFIDGDQVTPNSIELRCHSGLTLGVSPQSITATLVFMPAEEGAL